MEWLKKLPVVGPLLEKLMRTHAWRSYETLDRAHWTRLAAAITFISFLAVFPLITVAAAIGAAFLTPDRLKKLENGVAEQVPGISDQLDLERLVANAGTIGVVAGALLLFMGIGWVGSMRDCLRAVWGKDDEDEGNPVLRKAMDGVVLLGLGAAGLLSLVASGVASSAIGWSADRLGISENGPGGFLLQVAVFAVAVLADFLVLLYVLTLLPGVEPPRHRLIVAGLMGAIGFELLKVLLSSYISGVASRSMYGAFGVPIALLLWINFTAKLLLYCAAWTATQSKRTAEDMAKAEAEVEVSAAEDATASAGSPGTPHRPARPEPRP
ncbi:YihY/virulence factor BrkB family protein [Streptomyces sp. NPDC051219]|uniref:YihY/virulence factor BrkB family protein n=1 Tax=Streptomyces sp. NPDC051219 TaxID=3155283 RepID=UPI00342488A9